MAKEVIPTEVKDRVIELYLEGAKLDDIVTDTGVSRATVYYLLQSRGIKPSRRTRTTDPSVKLQDVIDQLVAAEKRNAQLMIAVELALNGSTREDIAHLLE